MSKYDADYFFILKPLDDETLPFLMPDQNTEDRTFRYEAQPMGSPPLVFVNAWREEREKKGITSRTADILFEGDDLVVRNSIRERLLEQDLPGLHMHPAIYIDDNDKWHEDYWYLTFTDRVDCWDRSSSDYEQNRPPLRLGGFELFTVYTYSLDQKVLDQLPIKQRLLFKLGGSTDAFILCHKSLARIFSGNGSSGADLTPIGDY
jgi:hypothetical protein